MCSIRKGLRFSTYELDEPQTSNFSSFSRSILQHSYVAIPFFECKISLFFFISLLRNVAMHVDNYRPT